MRLNCSTDYAIRVLIYLAKEASVVSSAKLSGRLGCLLDIYFKSGRNYEMQS